MAKKTQDGKINRSQAIRDLLKENPQIKAGDAVSALAQKGVEISAGLFYLVKGKVAGGKRRRRKNRKNAVILAVASAGADGSVTVVKAKSDALATIRKIKALAAEVGGLRHLKGLVDALSE